MSVEYSGIGLVLASAEAVGEVCVVSALGFALAMRGSLLPPAVSTLAKLTFNVFLPCLLYTSIAMAVAGVAALQSMWSVSALCVLQVAALFAVAAVGNAALRIPPPSRPLTTMMVAFNNSGYVPLVLIPAVLRRVPALLGEDRDSGMDRVNAYIAVWMSTLSVQLWVVGFSYFARETQRFARQMEEGAAEVDIEMTRLGGESENLLAPSAGDEEAAPPRERISSDSGKAQRSARVSLEDVSLDRGHSRESTRGEPTRGESTRGSWVMARWKEVQKSVEGSHALNPPMFASLAAVGTVVTPGARSFLIGDEAPLGFATDAMRLVGQAATPLSMVVLGAELAFSHIRSRPGYSGSLEGSGIQPKGQQQHPAATTSAAHATIRSPNLPARAVAGVSFQRLVVSPLLAVALMAGFAALLPPGSLHDDPLCRFVMLVEGATPSAMNLVLICMMQGVDPGPCARTLFYQYLLSVLTLTVWISIFLHVLWN